MKLVTKCNFCVKYLNNNDIDEDQKCIKTPIISLGPYMSNNDYGLSGSVCTLYIAVLGQKLLFRTII